MLPEIGGDEVEKISREEPLERLRRRDEGRGPEGRGRTLDELCEQYGSHRRPFGRAAWDKGAAGVWEQTRQVEQSLPFALRGMDFDNGTEWLNWHLIRYLQERPTPVRVTRSRPYHSDDNAHVEQKNWMWPRQLLGYGRLEDPGLVEPTNRVDEALWGPLPNFLLPSMKLIEKERVGSKWRRQHDQPQTAYQRLLKRGVLGAKAKRKLRDQDESLAPFELRDRLERSLRPILAKAWEVN